ncbi:lactoylglutathione lyase [Legionella feeleii]|uniref:Aldoketomutase n=1 Tax=Legionella feeleii TaxID=453 RepID=A0A0W0TMK2_9GAMM|nr:lactoylglutathione lyase [Legionella feeleii]KTC96828.1 lactoylglutathione lyase [Legionella feeleii]SPX60938.1 lactoylglutathione lyase [Legionella feeleii]
MRILHTMLRVTDLDKSIAFYTSMLNMKLISHREYPEGRFSLVFLGYPDNPGGAQLELTYNWDKNSYEKGDAYGHIAIAVDDVYQACARIKAQGGNIVRDAGPMKYGDIILAFVKDPDGYLIELLTDKGTMS